MKHQFNKISFVRSECRSFACCDNLTTFRTPVSYFWNRGFLFSSGLIGNCPAGHENGSCDDEWPLTKEKTPQAIPPAINKETSVLPMVRSTRTKRFKETAPGDKAALNAYLIQGSSIFTAPSMLNLGITVNN